MPRRAGDRVCSFWVSADEHALLKALAARERVSLVALLRMAVNAMAEESGDEVVFVEHRQRGRPRKVESARNEHVPDASLRQPRL